MGKFGSPQLGVFADGNKPYDDPKLNKCPSCGALFSSEKCPICGTICPDNMRANKRTYSKAVKRSHDALSFIVKIAIICVIFTFIGYYAYNLNTDNINDQQKNVSTESSYDYQKNELNSNRMSTDKADQTIASKDTQPVDSITVGEKNALRAAKNYISIMPFSKQRLMDQLEYEGYTTSEIAYAINNIEVDWFDMAAKSAKQYLDLMPFSREGLIEQLEYEGYTHEEAVYGVEQNGY